MSTGKTNIVELLSVCIDLARSAGNEIRKVARTGDLNAISKDADGNVVGASVTQKSILEQGTDPVTMADLVAQQIIEGSLHHYYPTLKLVGEEDIDPKDFRVVPVNKELLKSALPIPSGFQVERDTSKLTVFVDPLDATKEFVLGNEFCVVTLIGIAENGIPIAGVMYQPFVGTDGTMYWSLVGVGAGPNKPWSPEGSKRLESSDKADELVLVTSRLHNTPVIDQAIAKLKPAHVVRVGGAAYKVLTLVKGETDIYAYPTAGTKKWDTCAPEALLRHYGGEMTDSKGKQIPYFADSPALNETGLVCSRKAADHARFIQIINN